MRSNRQARPPRLGPFGLSMDAQVENLSQPAAQNPYKPFRRTSL